MQNTLPQFEPNQVLNSDHLNQVVLYLEEQGRLTRNHLLGNGIVSGLELKRSGNTEVTISEGVGVSSAGYLLMPQSDNFITAAGKRVIAYNKKRKFEPKSLLFPYTGNSDDLSISYALFAGLGDIFQLVETAVADNIDPGNVTALAKAELDNNVVVLFLQLQVKELKSCEADSCMELGRQWNFSVVPLLLTKADADKLLQNEFQFAPAPAVGADYDPLVNPVYYLPDLPLIKPVFNPGTVSDTISSIELANIYRNALSAFRTELIAGITNAADNNPYSIVDAGLKQIFKEDFIASPIAELRAKLTEVINDTSGKWKPTLLQYVYDYLKDFCSAYRELQDAVFELSNYELPKTDSFPHHLRLGSIPVTINDTVNSVQYPPNTYRHGFVYAIDMDKQKKAKHNALYLYKRQYRLGRHLINALNINDIRITPGSSEDKPLSKRVLPFYYAPVDRAKDAWNPAYTKQNKFNRILNYTENIQTADPAVTRVIPGIDPNTDKALYKPLNFVQPSADFFRIEGHISAAYADVFETISEYISNYNLSFDLQLVRLNKNTIMLIKDKHILFNDLESMHNVVSEEIKCLLATELNYFSNIKLTRSDTRQTTKAAQAAAAAPAAEASAKAAAQPAAKAAVQEMSFHSTSMALRKETKQVLFGMTKEYRLADYGVTESVANISNKFAGMVAAEDIPGLLITGSFGVFQRPTAAAPYITRIISAINDLVKVLGISFEVFNIDDYENKLNALETETKSFVLFAKNLSDAVLKSENNIVKGELLDYLDRIMYECDFQKISALDDERVRREQQVGVNNYLQQYISQNPGIEHLAGVPKGGTFILVFDEQGIVVADFSLPYRCCAGGTGTQFVLGVLKTILLAGQVIDINGVPVKIATVTLNDEPLVLDETAHFKKAVPPNSFLLLKISAEGFEPKEIQIAAAEDDIVQNITLFTKAQELKTNFILTVTGPDDKPLATAAAKLDDAPLQLNNDGVFKGQVKANANFTLTVSLNGFKTYTESFATTIDDKTISVKMVKLVSISGTITGPDGQPVTKANVLLNNALITSDNGKFNAANLEGDGTYNLVIEAENLEKFAETIAPANADVVRNITLQRIATFTVKVGVYVSSNTDFNTRATAGSDTLSTRLGTTSGLSRISGGSRISTGLGTSAGTGIGGVFTRDTRLDPNILVTGAGTGGTNTDFTFLSGSDLHSEIDGVAQRFDDALRLFNSDEKKANHKLQVTFKPVNLDFNAKFPVADKDILALIPAIQGYRFEGVFSINIIADADNIKACNDFLVKQFNIKAGAIVMTRTFEIRFFTKTEASQFAELLKAARVRFLLVAQ